MTFKIQTSHSLLEKLLRGLTDHLLDNLGIHQLNLTSPFVRDENDNGPLYAFGRSLIRYYCLGIPLCVKICALKAVQSV